jgi:hypothetical protein
MTRFVGLDVSQKMTVICVVDDAGRRLWRGQCPTVRQIVRDWVLRFNAEGLGGLLNDKAPATPTIGKMSTFKS